MLQPKRHSVSRRGFLTSMIAASAAMGASALSAQASSAAPWPVEAPGEPYGSIVRAASQRAGESVRAVHISGERTIINQMPSPIARSSASGRVTRLAGAQRQSQSHVLRRRESFVSMDVLRRVEQAMNAHDLEALVGCFTEDYHCEIPMHPARSFVGQDQVRRNWTGLFTNVPDLRARVLRSAQDGDLLWSEWEMTGTTTAGTVYLARGVAILGIKGDRITWSRFYIDPVTDAPAGPAADSESDDLPIDEGAGGLNTVAVDGLA
jgi:ketosteroid isomerase-like protein